MRTKMRMRTSLLLLSLVALAMPSVTSADEGWWGGLDKGKDVALADIFANPDAFRGRTLTFNAIFHRRDRMYDPLRSGFNAQAFSNFAMWADGAAIWEREAYTDSYPFFYLRKSNAQRDALVRIPMFTRLQVTARLRGSVRGKPAFDVLSFRPTGHRLGRQAVKLMTKGDAFAERGDMRTAASNYSEVLGSHPDLPPVYDLKVRKRLADALRELGYAKKAAQVEGGSPIYGASSLPRKRADPFQPDADAPMPSFDDGPIGGDGKTGRGRGRGRGTGRVAPRGDTTGSPDGPGDTSGSPDGSPEGAAPTWDDTPIGGDLLPRANNEPPALAPVRMPGGVPPKRTTRLAGVK